MAKHDTTGNGQTIAEYIVEEKAKAEVLLLRRIDQLAYNIVEGERKIGEAASVLSKVIPKRLVLAEVTIGEAINQLAQLQSMVCTQIVNYAERANYFRAGVSAYDKQAFAMECFVNMQQEFPEFPPFLEKETTIDLFQQVMMCCELQEKIIEAEAIGDGSLSVEIVVLNQPIMEAEANLRFDQFLLNGQIEQLLLLRHPSLEAGSLPLKQYAKEYYKRLTEEEIPKKYTFISAIERMHPLGTA